MVHKRGKGVKNVQKMSTWFMAQTIAFRDVTVKFFDMGLRIRTMDGNFVKPQKIPKWSFSGSGKGPRKKLKFGPITWKFTQLF